MESATTRWAYLEAPDRPALGYVFQSAPLLPRSALVGAQSAGRLRAALGRLRPKSDEGFVNLLITTDGEVGRFDIPLTALGLLADVLDDLSEGRTVAVAPYDLALGPEEVARQLGVSRTWVDKLGDRDTLPCSRVGQKRRFRLGDVSAYRRMNAKRRQPSEESWAFLDEEAYSPSGDSSR